MVAYTTLSDEEVNRVFRALADATRRDILARVLVGEQSISDLASHYEMTFAAVQKHVASLEGAGLVTKRRNGRERGISGNLDAISAAQALLSRYELLWRSRIDRLDALLEMNDR